MTIEEMGTLKLIDIVLVRYPNGTVRETVNSFIEAAQYCVDNSTSRVIMMFHDDKGKEIILTFSGTTFSNEDTFLTINT